MQRTEAVEFLLKRTGKTDRAMADKLAEALGDLPLALEQAGAYIDATAESLATYLELFRTRRQEIWQRSKPSKVYPATVATTREIALQQVATQSAAATDLLNLCAFLAPDDIPKGMIAQGAEHLPSSLAEVVADPLKFNDPLAALRRFSLLEIKGDGLSLHRLVQTGGS